MSGQVPVTTLANGRIRYTEMPPQAVERVKAEREELQEQKKLLAAREAKLADLEKQVAKREADVKKREDHVKRAECELGLYADRLSKRANNLTHREAAAADGFELVEEDPEAAEE